MHGHRLRYSTQWTHLICWWTNLALLRIRALWPTAQLFWINVSFFSQMHPFNFSSWWLKIKTDCNSSKAISKMCSLKSLPTSTLIYRAWSDKQYRHQKTCSLIITTMVQCHASCKTNIISSLAWLVQLGLRCRRSQTSQVTTTLSREITRRIKQCRSQC